MANVKTIFDKYKAKKSLCPKCKKDYLIPFGTTANKAHSFYCPNCNYEAHQTPALNIE